MKTTIDRTIEKLFLGSAIVCFFTLFSASETAYAQKQASFQTIDSTPAEPGIFQANIFPSADRLVLKIVFINPAKEAVRLQVRNSDRELVYERIISETGQYNSKFNVSELPDGKYVFEVKTAKKRFSQPFEISTQTARLTYVP
jgi:hypothetical protein